MYQSYGSRPMRPMVGGGVKDLSDSKCYTHTGHSIWETDGFGWWETPEQRSFHPGWLVRLGDDILASYIAINHYFWYPVMKQPV